MAPTLESIQHAFFEAMSNGWAQNVQKIKVEEFPSSKAIPFVFGSFRVLDTYLVTPYSNKSAGLTVIWYQDEPVWIMHYGGRYDKVAIPFLKTCLYRAYIFERRFYGGRGPVFVRDEYYTYVNMIDKNEFADFAGEEQVFDLDNRCLGYHWYRGMSLLGDSQ